MKFNSWVLLVLILVLALFLRINGLDQKEYGIDEDISIRDAQMVRDFGSFYYEFPVEINPPIFFNLLGLILTIKDSVLALRIFMAFIGVFSVLVFFIFVKRFSNVKIALFSAFLYALSPTHVIYSQHVRVYIVLTLLFSLSLYFLYRFIFQNDSPSLFFLGITYTISVYFHYYTMLFMLGGVIAVLVFYLMDRNLKFGSYLVMGLIVFILAIPGLLLLKTQFTTYQKLGGTEGLGGIAPLLTPKVALYPIYKDSVMIDYSKSKQDFPLILLLFPLLSGLALYGGYCLYKTDRRKFLFASLNFMMPYMIYAVAGFLFPIFSFRYLIFLLPLFVFFYSYGLYNLKNKYLRCALIALVIIGFIFILYFYYDLSRFYKWGEHIAV